MFRAGRTHIIPIGAYDSARLANLGLGHRAIDAGGGYTYTNPQAGHEFSAGAGFTFNLENPNTNYESRIDFHRRSFSPNNCIGLIGHKYQQVCGDSRLGDQAGPFKSRGSASRRRSDIFSARG